MNVGIIGAGLQGRRHAAALQKVEGWHLVSVCDANIDAARALAAGSKAEATSSWEEVVRQPQVDAIVVCTPPNLHAPVSIAAMQQNKHVLCEKPLGRTRKEAETIVRMARETGLKLKCGCNLRHHPAIAQARKWLDEDKLGRPLFLRCRYGICGRPEYENDWRAKSGISGGGELMDQGFHVLDLCRWFLGDFDEAFAFLSTAF